MFNEIEDLKDLAIAVKLPNTKQYIINLGLTLINNNKTLKKEITDW